MRVAALYYIHGNIAAPEAVLAEVRAERTNLVVVGGEVLRGPMVRKTLCCPRSDTNLEPQRTAQSASYCGTRQIWPSV